MQTIQRVCVSVCVATVWSQKASTIAMALNGLYGNRRSQGTTIANSMHTLLFSLLVMFIYTATLYCMRG